MIEQLLEGLNRLGTTPEFLAIVYLYRPGGPDVRAAIAARSAISMEALLGCELPL
jgi:hypothetical protein